MSDIETMQKMIDDLKAQNVELRAAMRKCAKIALAAAWGLDESEDGPSETISTGEA